MKEKLAAYKTAIALVISIFTLVGIVWGVQSHIEATYAHSADVRVIEQRLEQKIFYDEKFYIQKQIWDIEDRYYGKEMSEEAKERYRQLKYDLEEIKEKIENITKEK